jgi:hypothetical protein
MNPNRFLDKYAVRSFYHFTDERNLPSIRAQGGLLSRRELAARRLAPAADSGVPPPAASAGLDLYVPLCLVPEHPVEAQARQENRLVHTRFVGVDPRILGLEGVRFCADPAGPKAQLLTLKDAAKSIDFSVLYERHDWRDPAVQERRRRAKAYQLLVPQRVPLTSLRNL